MNAQNKHKHYRSSTINRYEDFEMYPEDQKKSQEILGDLSTKETPVQQTPDYEIYLYEMSQIHENIQNCLKQEQNYKEQRSKSLRNKVLEAFFNVSSSPLKIRKKKIRKPNNSIGKITKRTLKTDLGRSKRKLSDNKSKKIASLAPKLKNPHCKSLNLPQITVRTMRTGSSNSDFKSSVLV
ncbi:hypothetical protein SteCoe_15843 [Stentor coeruleus]|uniref:Uncharacterized protein n=1 Tax=Stentor coeruleus TaxID=5963 RepID=A0A1R2C2T4_9CILI|nr:hypothetical protein SteCoe_15843 [Stentor coeruleus]